jgi:hypothetical protein
MAEIPEYIKAFTDKYAEADKANKKFMGASQPKPKITWRRTTLDSPATGGGSSSWLPAGTPSLQGWPSGAAREETERQTQAGRTGTVSGLPGVLKGIQSGMAARDASFNKTAQEMALNPSAKREMQYDPNTGFPLVYASEAEMPEYYKGRQALYQKGTAFVANPVLAALGQKPYEEQPENIRSLISMAEEAILLTLSEGAAWKGAGKMMYADINRDFDKQWQKMNGDARLNYSIEKAQPYFPFAEKQTAVTQAKDFMRRYYTEGRLGGVETTTERMPAPKPEVKPAVIPKFTETNTAVPGQTLTLAQIQAGIMGSIQRPDDAINNDYQSSLMQAKALEESIKNNNASKFTWLIPKKGKLAGELETITKAQYQRLVGKPPLKNILTKDGQHVKWEYALDDAGTEQGFKNDKDFYKAILKAQDDKRRLVSLKNDVMAYTDEMKQAKNDPRAGLYDTIDEAQRVLDLANKVLEFDPENEDAIHAKDIAELSLDDLSQKQPQMQAGTSVQTGLPGMQTKPPQIQMFGELGGAGSGGQKQGLMDATQLTQQAAAKLESDRLRKLGQSEAFTQPVVSPIVPKPAESTGSDFNTKLLPIKQAEYDALVFSKAPDTAYRDFFSTVAKDALRKGETWQKKAQTYLEQLRQRAQAETPAAAPQATPAPVETPKATPQPVTTPAVETPTPVDQAAVTPPPAEPPKPPVAEAVPEPEGEKPSFTETEVQNIRKFWSDEVKKVKRELKVALTEQRQKLGKEADIDAMKVEAIKRRLIEVVKSNVPEEGQGRFLTAVKNVKTGKQLLRALDLAQKVATEYDEKSIKSEIKKEIETTIPKGGKGKFTADIQAKLNIFRKVLNASAETRQNMILNNSGQALAGKITPQEAQERNHLIRMADLSGRDVVSLTDILNQIKQYKQTSKLVRAAETQAARRIRIGYGTTEDAIIDLSQYLTPRKGYKEKPITGHKTVGEFLHDVNDSISVRADKMQRVLFEMDGADYNGKMSNAFIKSTSRASEGEARILQNWNDEFKQFVKDTGIDIGKLASRKLIKTGDVGLTSVDRITIYMQSKNERGTNHLIKGNKYSQDFIDEVVTSLTPEEKAFGDFLLKHYDEQKDIIAPVYELIYGVPFPAEENYSPIIIDRKEVGGGTAHADAKDIMKQEADNAGISRGFTKEREAGAAQPIILDAIGIYLRNMMDVAHFVAYAPTVYDLNTILKSKEMHDSIIRHSSAPVYGIMNKWLNDVASNDPSRIRNIADQAARYMRQNSTSAVLFGNILSSLKQTISMNTSIAEVGELPMLQGLISHAVDYKGTLKLMREYSPVAAERVTQSISRQRIAFKNSTQMLKGKRSAQEIGMLLTGFIDENAVSVTWRAVYEEYLRKNPGKNQEAATYATDVASRTQNWNLTKDLSEYYRLGELGKLVTMFTQEQNQQYNYIRHDIIGKAIHGKINPFEAVRRIFWSFIIPAMLMGVISRARIPKKWEEAGSDLAIQAIGLIPILGPFLQSGLGGYQYGGAITTELLEGMQNTAYSAGKGNWLGVAEDMAAFTGMLLGLPVNQTRRLYQAYEAYPKVGLDAWREALYGKTQAAKQRKENWQNPYAGEVKTVTPVTPTPTKELVPVGTPTPPSAPTSTPAIKWRRTQIK